MSDDASVWHMRSLSFNVCTCSNFLHFDSIDCDVTSFPMMTYFSWKTPALKTLVSDSDLNAAITVEFVNISKQKDKPDSSRRGECEVALLVLTVEVSAEV